MNNSLAHLRQFIVHHYSLEEVRTLCFDLGINYDELSGEGVGAKVRELLLQMGRQRRLDQLLTRLRQAHPQLFDGAGLSIDHSYLSELYAQLPSAAVYDNRQRPHEQNILMRKVEAFWVESVLEDSIHGVAPIELDKKMQMNSVEYPWDAVLRITHSQPYTLPTEKHIVNVFDEAKESLLILGEPGSGKTTMLLELARALIVRAEQNQALPVPVVFNLSSWTDKNQPFDNWLIDELNEKYLIPKRISRVWINDDKLLLLLDGLDEVAPIYRNECVQAINDFLQDHLVSLIVCSRVTDYEGLASKLKLQAAIILQPLTSQQIDNYLTHAGQEFIALRTTLQNDATLRELVQSPLLLSILTLAYREISIKELQALNTIESQRRYLFSIYVRQMFKRRGSNHPFPDKQTIFWLSWMAQKMVESSLTVFLLESIQPAWLATNRQRQLYTISLMLFTGLPIGLLFGLSAGLPVGLFSVDIGRIIGLGVGLSAAIIIWLAVKQNFGLVGGLAVGLVTGLAFGVPFYLVFGQFVGILIALAIGSVAGLAFSFAGSLIKARLDVKGYSMEIFETLNWSWSRAVRGLAIGIAPGIIFGLAVWLAVGRPFGLIFGISFSLAFGLASGFVVALLSGLRGEAARVRTTPNQGVWQSGINSLRIGLIVGSVVGLIVGLASGWTWALARVSNGLFVGLSVGLLVGSAFGLSIGLFSGGLAFIQHFILRFILYRNGHTPLNYIRFLDYASERIFLRKIGGGYIFIHRLLMEHFASQKNEV
jgi:hypothetical protein